MVTLIVKDDNRSSSKVDGEGYLIFSYGEVVPLSSAYKFGLKAGAPSAGMNSKPSKCWLESRALFHDYGI